MVQSSFADAFVNRTRSLQMKRGGDNPFDHDASEFYRSDSLNPYQSKRGNLDKLKGECYIGFPKLLKSEMAFLDKKDSFILGQFGSFEKDRAIRDMDFSEQKKLSNSEESTKREDPRYKEFQERIWYCGKHVGEVRGRLMLTGVPVF